MQATQDHETRRFYLVQRIKRSPSADIPPQKRTGLAAIRNPFGYGTLGDYDLDYMGSAEFEWGAIPDAFDRLVKAGKKGLATGEFEHAGHSLDFLWLAQDGEPFADWAGWADGAPLLRYGREMKRHPCEGKESAYELRQRLDGEQPGEWGWRADVWWALHENVMWSFTEDGHLQRMLDSMCEPDSVNRLRGMR